MKKIIIGLLLTLFFIKAESQIAWNQQIQINWANFKGVPVKGIGMFALTSSSISVAYICNTNCLKYNVVAEFDENNSWVITPNIILLDHERLHFDIAELYARKIRKVLNECYQRKTSADSVSFYINSLQEKFAGYQVLYDEETLHSRNSGKQQSWRKKVDVELKQLIDYAITEYKDCKKEVL